MTLLLLITLFLMQPASMSARPGIAAGKPVAETPGSPRLDVHAFTFAGATAVPASFENAGSSWSNVRRDVSFRAGRTTDLAGPANPADWWEPWAGDAAASY